MCQRQVHCMHVLWERMCKQKLVEATRVQTAISAWVSLDHMYLWHLHMILLIHAWIYLWYPWWNTPPQTYLNFVMKEFQSPTIVNVTAQWWLQFPSPPQNGEFQQCLQQYWFRSCICYQSQHQYHQCHNLFVTQINKFQLLCGVRSVTCSVEEKREKGEALNAKFPSSWFDPVCTSQEKDGSLLKAFHSQLFLVCMANSLSNSAFFLTCIICYLSWISHFDLMS